MAEYESISHTFEPIYNEQSRILILGTFPSVKSREQHFYYGHPQNRFWRLLSRIYGEEIPKSIEEKKSMLLKNKVAIWDVIKSCEIIGSSDSSIKNVVANDVESIILNSNIKHIYANGAKAEQLYNKFLKRQVGREIIKLPSTSPANAAFSMDRLFEKWIVIKNL